MGYSDNWLNDSLDDALPAAEHGKDAKQGTNNDASMTAYIATQWRDHQVSCIWLLLYVAATAIVFLQKAFQIAAKDSPAISTTLIMAKASGAVLNLQACLLLLPVSRHFITWLQHPWKNYLFPSLPLAHKVMGISFGFFSFTHTLGHVCQYVEFVNVRDEQDAEESIAGLLGVTDPSILPATTFGRWVMLLKLRASWTGILMLLLMGIAFGALRSKDYSRFWNRHQLLILVLVLQCFHGTGNLLQRFQSICWLAAPFALYVLPRIYRETHCCTANVLSAKVLPAGPVIELTLRRPKGWSHLKAGMYANIQVPAISRWEWHPFTMSSCPSDEHLRFHIRCLGDWTQNFLQLVKQKQDEEMQKFCSSIRLEGPFGTPMHDFSNYPVVVLIGAGIGITVSAILYSCLLPCPFPFSLAHTSSPFPYQPMISALRELRHNPGCIHQVILYWTVPDESYFDWFPSIADEGHPFYSLQVRRFLTRPGSYPRKSSSDVRMGRPDWAVEMKTVAQEALAPQCGVFVCGPAAMASQIRKACTAVSRTTAVHMHVSQETF